LGQALVESNRLKGSEWNEQKAKDRDRMRMLEERKGKSNRRREDEVDGDVK